MTTVERLSAAATTTFRNSRMKTETRRHSFVPNGRRFFTPGEHQMSTRPTPPLEDPLPSLEESDLMVVLDRLNDAMREAYIACTGKAEQSSCGPRDERACRLASLAAIDEILEWRPLMS